MRTNRLILLIAAVMISTMAMGQSAKSKGYVVVTDYLKADGKKDVSDILENNLYSIRHTPSVYIFDLDGIVLLKDASVESAIDFLRKR